MRKLLKRLKHRYGHVYIGYIWCREHNKHKSEAQHYHIALILNGHIQRHPFNILVLIEEIWANRGHPKPYTPRHCYYLLSRGDTKQYQNVFTRLSYLAKAYSKEDSPKACNDYSRLLKAWKCTGSMSRKGNCRDNAVAESFFGSLKQEQVHWCHYQTRYEAQQDILNYITMFYNSQRLHSTLGYMSPNQYEEAMAKLKNVA